MATAAGLAFSDSFGLVIPKFQAFGDPNGAFGTINVGGSDRHFNQSVFPGHGHERPKVRHLP